LKVLYVKSCFTELLLLFHTSNMAKFYLKVYLKSIHDKIRYSSHAVGSVKNHGVFNHLFFVVLVSAMLFSACGSKGQGVQAPSQTSKKITWVWEDTFSMAEQHMLTRWIDEVYLTTDSLLGPFPFDVAVHFYKRADAGEPVPWAHTRRSGKQSLHFHVDPAYDLEDFRQDWTAPHEISHLALPFLGRSNSWFAEGFATYMQNQVMLAMGTMTLAEVERKMKEKISYNQRFFAGKQSPFVEVCTELVSEHHNYPAMYWGSTSFFIRLDQGLIKMKDMDLNQFIQLYQNQGRMTDQNLEELIQSWDAISDSTFCQELMKRYTEEPADMVFKELKI
jgi:hypothetical protein